MAPDFIEVEATAMQASAVSPVIEEASWKIMVDTANRYPRNMTVVANDIMSAATVNVETAEAMFYNLKKGGKPIFGPSVRLAEVAMTCYRNMRVGTRILDVGPTSVTVEAVAFDMQNNVCASAPVTVQLVKSDGTRYSQNMIETATMAALSKARRNAVIMVIPRHMIDAAWKKAQKIVAGDEKPIEQVRKEMFDLAAKGGLTKEQVMDAYGCITEEDIGINELLAIRSDFARIKAGEASKEELFPKRPAGEGAAAPRSAKQKADAKIAEAEKKRREAAEAQQPQATTVSKPKTDAIEPVPPDPDTAPVPSTNDEALTVRNAVMEWTQAKRDQWEARVNELLQEGVVPADAQTTAYNELI